MTELLAPNYTRRRWAAAVGLLAVVVIILVVVLSGGSGSTSPSAATASVIPGDALAYVNLSLDRSRPAVKQALAVAGRFPGFSLAGGVELGRLDEVLAGGHAVDFSSQVAPWIGGSASLALLNTTTATAGSLVVAQVSDLGRAHSFVHAQGAVNAGSYRGRQLLTYPDGGVVAFVGSDLVIGQNASVREAIDVAAGSTAALSGRAAYRRAFSTAPAGSVIEAYASVAGVRRVLAAQGGALGALGDLLYQPALQGVGLSLVPTAQGAHIQIHSALDPSLTKLSSSSQTPFAPSLQADLPAAASLMLDVTGLDRVAPQVFNAGSAAGVAGGLGTLLSRLGSALTSEGVNVSQLISIFHGESAVAIVPNGQTPSLVIIARTTDQARTRSQLAQLEAPLAQLFRTSSQTAGSEPVFNDRPVAGITAHQLQLTTGLQLDYAVFRGLVVISTNLKAIGDVAQNAHPLSRASGFALAVGDRPKLVTTLVFANLAQLLGVGKVAGLTNSSTYDRLQPDLQRIGAVGLSSTHDATDSVAELSVQVLGGNGASQ